MHVSILSILICASCTRWAGASSHESKLLAEEEGALDITRGKLEAWCEAEVASQEQQRRELQRLKAQLPAVTSGEDGEVHRSFLQTEAPQANNSEGQSQELRCDA